ncbi:winged helix-turn-helix domain-containing protein [Methanospirillum stamsii]|uniref:winged helix-turn-helix domain-containing protein n=1 Tax=Methanospirillum stamsii TaxID=1277351 RepID=UPI001FE7B569|nr:winged helix-turn-helix domain-containing protein [Methanospirillum stamsii]
MAIPDYQAFMLPVLLAVKDGNEHSNQDIYKLIASSFQLSEEELNQKLPSGVQSTFDNRVGWAKTYIKSRTGYNSVTRKGEDY